MIQWEYKTEAPTFGIWLEEHEFLAKNGQECWELTAVNFTYNPIRYYFKRPIPQPSAVQQAFKEVSEEIEGSIHDIKINHQ